MRQVHKIYFDVNPLEWKISIASFLLRYFVKLVEMRFLEIQFVAMCNIGASYFLLINKFM